MMNSIILLAVLLGELAFAQSQIIGNTSSLKYHKDGIDHLPPNSIRKDFDDTDGAINEGYSACSACFYTAPNIAYYNLEIQLGKSIMAAFQSREQILYTHPLVDSLKGRIESILLAWKEPLKGYDYNIQIVRDSSPNAMAIPGGNIFITTGLIDLIENEGELDFILAHEIAHIERRHSLRQFLRMQELQESSAIMNALVAAVAVGMTGDYTVASSVLDVYQSYEYFSIEMVSKGFSRELEEEADVLALINGEPGTFTRESASSILDKLAVHSLTRGQQIIASPFSDHPSLKSRFIQSREGNTKPISPPLTLALTNTLSNAEDIYVIFKYSFIAPSSALEGQDLVGLVGEIRNDSKEYDLRIEELRIALYSSIGKAVYPSGVTGKIVLNNSTIDFGTSILAPKGLGDQVLKQLENRDSNVTVQLSVFKPSKPGSKKKPPKIFNSKAVWK
jgi:Zn-dependent protease with chaperone function|tara:strand:+ start:402 stop:1745 length:1344 start_codon:yes stop_codon:yes gene_type:complete